MIDTTTLWSRVEAARRRGKNQEALEELRALVQLVERIDFEYEEWLRTMVDCLVETGQSRSAVACQAYLGPIRDPAASTLQRETEAAQAGDEDALRGMRLLAIYLSRASRSDAAAKWFEAAGMPVHHAIELERAGQDNAAMAAWRRLIEQDSFPPRSYPMALAKINLGLCLHRLDHEQTRPALALATAAIEEVADSYERQGLRERAFDCYQLLARIGVETASFENVAEGYINSVRILKDDSLGYDALRLYETFITLAKRFGEHHAVAGILREAGDYCTKVGLPFGDALRWRSADAWMSAAVAAQEKQMPLQIVENAYLAAAEAYVSVRAFKQCARAYRALSELELRGRERFTRLLTRLGRRPEDPPHPIPVPEYLKGLPDYEEVWYVDLAEWELRGDPALVAAGVMSDRRFPDFVRRHALLLVLEMLRQDRSASMLEIVRRLREIRAYPVIDALEKIYDRAEATVQSEVCRVMGTLHFKRSFNLLTRAVSNGAPTVRKAACEAISELSFSHALDRLRRLFEARDLPDLKMVRQAALRAIGKISTPDALAFLCDQLRRDEAPFAEQALAAISELESADLAVHLRQHMDDVPPRYRSVLDDAANRLDRRQRGRRRA